MFGRFPESSEIIGKFSYVIGTAWKRLQELKSIGTDFQKRTPEQAMTASRVE